MSFTHVLLSEANNRLKKYILKKINNENLVFYGHLGVKIHERCHTFFFLHLY